MGLFDKLFGKSKEEEVTTMAETLRIAIVQGSVREGRNGAAVADWQ